MVRDSACDLIVFGASGFTGRLVAEYLATRYGKKIKWGMAGRDLEKLATVRAEIGAPDDTLLIKADSDDEASLQALARSTRAVISTVGPFQLFGSKLVAACARAGTDYLDLSGETVWMRSMIDAHEDEARSSGARIIFSCGFDSVPFELGVFFLQGAARKAWGEPAEHVKGRVRVMKGTFSGGTAASSRATMAAAMSNPKVLDQLKDPFLLTPGFAGPKQPHGMKIEFDEDLGAWVAPFIMSPINTRNVHRSNALMGHSYGTGFVYDEMIVAGPGKQGEMTAAKIAEDNRSFGGEGSPKPGEGPSKAEREAGCYDILFIGSSKDRGKISVAVRGDRDPGYGSTSKMITECAICLLQDASDVAAGIWTPGAAMGEKLIPRLVRNAGLTFKVES
ncbi:MULTISPECIES: trans-acting enoyl reductase family protein [unclassified Bradyrhizobium]|uniref:saccharopine dehydrogenase family protein n=1 Tax=unclassified Bradyrhizobium TaxID=2631580 RepID=UPI001FF36644|nr:MULTISPECIES: saccharopine dehydrogenase NADP-binding domain-containing protein [unclassified Bradyrhizobium]MCJ9699889.1 saccharopine dehydrogenase NADP-binding domain-containing protein [Bradyrhizobium sp. SHOUNA76]MCJ9728875.1 saccharopine dehydrogenase NADP-binding domain-containing protein [Bradyrhizobium sp. PRIMUS42]